jgi:hypothetical protein
MDDAESNADDAYFDRIVGALQDIVIADSFEKMQRAFVSKYVDVFDNAEENKPEYMTIFKKYHDEVEVYLAKVSISLFRNSLIPSKISIWSGFCSC